MERLTFDGSFCDIAKCAETPGGSFCENGACSQRKVWERLKDYEDTGLTPAEVRSMHGEWQAMMSVVNSIGGYDCLRELAEAVKDRRVWVLPCKVGDTVYSVSQVLVGVRPYIVDRVIEPYFRVKDVENGTLAGGFYLQEFGRTVFLAREEAEKALEEAKHRHE